MTTTVLHQTYRAFLLLAAASTMACDDGARRRNSPVLPDTQTVDGVLEMRHDADAFARAPQWVIDTAVTLALIPTGGVNQGVYEHPAVLRLPGGTWAMLGMVGGRLVLFDSTGGDSREYWPDQRPGGRFGWSSLLTSSHDTIIVIDAVSGAVHRYTLDGRTRVDSFPVPDESCLHVIGLLPGERLLARQCVADSVARQPGPRGREPTVIVTAGGDFADVVPFATLPGDELSARPAPWSQLFVRLGQFLHVVVWETTVVTATGESGYAIDLRTPGGAVTRRLTVDVPRRLVTPEMRTALTARWGESIIADTMPPFARVRVGADGLLWVVDAMAPTDSVWTATAFRSDGAIVGRLTATRPLPDWFGAGKVMQVGWRTTNQYTRQVFHVKAIVARAAR